MGVIKYPDKFSKDAGIWISDILNIDEWTPDNK